ncbi:hypothetical protein CC79DRAFT_906638 [Sarocladium strictum]
MSLSIHLSSLVRSRRSCRRPKILPAPQSRVRRPRVLVPAVLQRRGLSLVVRIGSPERAVPIVVHEELRYERQTTGLTLSHIIVWQFSDFV